jgi:hypothetical protein
VRSTARAQRRAEREELAGLEVAQLLGQPRGRDMPELVGGALHVDVEPGAADQLVQQLGGHVLVQLRQPLRGADQRHAALAAPRREVDHGRRLSASPVCGAKTWISSMTSSVGCQSGARRVDERVEEPASRRACARAP